MTLAVPSHLVDTMGSAAAAGVEAAGHLLHEVGNAVAGAAVATTDRARSITGLGRRNRSLFSGRNLLILGALAAVAALVVRRRASATHGSSTSTSSGSDRQPAAGTGTADKATDDDSPTVAAAS
jgi:hypothetical protein